MKKIFVFILFVLFTLPVSTFAQTTKEKKDLVGKWLFEAPSAPEGYTFGIIEVGFAEKKYSTAITFTPINSKFTGEMVRFENDTLSFKFFVENEDVAITLKLENATKMSGKAVYSGGVVPLSLTKETKKE